MPTEKKKTPEMKDRALQQPPRDRMLHRAHAVVRSQEGIRGTFHTLAEGEAKKPEHAHD